MGESFNLLDERWLPIIWKNGTPGKVGIREALLQAGKIRQIAASNPMDRVAIVRFLLAVLYWCKGNPPDSGSATPEDGLQSGWFTRLEANRDRFNLLGDGTRFLQDRNAQRRRAATDLIQEVPTGNNFWHFRHSTDEFEGLCPACCATGLLRLPLFCVSGLPDLKAGINGTPPVYVVPWGTSLLETLKANWTPCGNLGDPAWIDPAIRPAHDQDVPLLTGLTLLSRRVWLHVPTPPPGPCICCGAKEPTLIRTCEFQSAGEQRNDHWNDPHAVYITEAPRKAARAADLTRAGRFSMDRPWPDLLANIIETGKFADGNNAVCILLVGFATDKAKNIDVWERTLWIPARGTMQPNAALLIHRWQKESSILKRRLQRVHEKISGRKHVEIPPMLAAIRPQVEDRVSAMAGELLSGSDAIWEQAAGEYRTMMGAVAKSLSPGFTVSAVARRRQIESVAPNMRAVAETGKKLPRAKGGNK
jgi:CRISPR type I-E-associated protein CasA/Cse1